MSGTSGPCTVVECTCGCMYATGTRHSLDALVRRHAVSRVPDRIEHQGRPGSSAARSTGSRRALRRPVRLLRRDVCGVPGDRSQGQRRRYSPPVTEERVDRVVAAQTRVSRRVPDPMPQLQLREARAGSVSAPDGVIFVCTTVHGNGCVPGAHARSVSVTLRIVTAFVSGQSLGATRAVQGGVYRCVPDVYRKNVSLRLRNSSGTHGTRLPENATSVRVRPCRRGKICRRRGAVFSGGCVPSLPAARRPAAESAVHRCGRSLWTNGDTSPIDSAASLLLGCVAYPERTARGTFA